MLAGSNTDSVRATRTAADRCEPSGRSATGAPAGSQGVIFYPSASSGIGAFDADGPDAFGVAVGNKTPLRVPEGAHGGVG